MAQIQPDPDDRRETEKCQKQELQLDLMMSSLAAVSAEFTGAGTLVSGQPLRLL